MSAMARRRHFKLGELFSFPCLGAHPIKVLILPTKSGQWGVLVKTNVFSTLCFDNLKFKLLQKPKLQAYACCTVVD